MKIAKNLIKFLKNWLKNIYELIKSMIKMMSARAITQYFSYISLKCSKWYNLDMHNELLL